MEALLGLFAAAFLSATILPGASEVLLVALIVKGYAPAPLWAVATVANTLGSVVNWILGRYLLRYEDRSWFPFQRHKLRTAEQWFEKRGVWSLTLAWVPLVGDALTFIAGLMRTPLWIFLILVFIGKAARYAVVIALIQRAI